MNKKSSKPPSVTTEQKIQWHPGFIAAMKLELRDYAEQLTFREEHLLNPKPIQIDLLVIEKTDDLVIKEAIAKNFRRHNIFEYKSPGDELSIDTFFKTMGYACLYKAATQKVNEIPAEDILITLVRSNKPEKLLRWLRQNYAVSEEHPGIYYIEHAGLFSAQLIVSDELLEKDAVWLQSLTNRLQKQQAENLLAELEESSYGRYERTLIEAILKVSMTANKEIYKQVGEEETVMFDALREIMAADFQKAEEKGVGIGELRKARETATELSRMGLPVEKIAKAVKVPMKQVEEWLAESLVMA